MYKKILIILVLLISYGCSASNINLKSIEEIIDDQIVLNNNNTTINKVGYKYYLPQEFSVQKDGDYIQGLVSNNEMYYLNINLVAYHYKNTISTSHDLDDYEYYEFSNDSKEGYLKITKNNDNFYIELCYNYAIIEAEIKESNLKYAVSRGIAILNSIKYNDLVIEKYIMNNDLDSNETIYNVPEPKNKDESKKVLEYIESDEKEKND